MIGPMKESKWTTLASEGDEAPPPGTVTTMREAMFAYRAEADEWLATQQLEGFTGKVGTYATSYFGPTDSPSNAWLVIVERDNAERCTHCGATSGLIADDWAVWHCLDRTACIGRQIGPIWLTGEPYQVVALGQLEQLEARVAELTQLLDKAEAVAAHFEVIASEAVTACAGIARAHELNAVADKLEASWYAAARPSPKYGRGEL